MVAAAASAVPHLEPAGCLVGAAEGRLAHGHIPNAAQAEVETEEVEAAAHEQMLWRPWLVGWEPAACYWSFLKRQVRVEVLLTQVGWCCLDR